MNISHRFSEKEKLLNAFSEKTNKHGFNEQSATKMIYLKKKIWSYLCKTNRLQFI